MSEEIKAKFSGKGNSWLKIDFNNKEAAELVKNHLKNIDGAEHYLKLTQNAGFYWIRFSKVIKNKDYSLFEVRYRGSTIDHKDSAIEISNRIVMSCENLSDTPKKLMLEDVNKKSSNTKNIKQEKEKTHSNKSRRTRNRKNSRVISREESDAISFKINLYPTTPKVLFKLPDDFNIFSLFLKLEGVEKIVD